MSVNLDEAQPFTEDSLESFADYLVNGYWEWEGLPEDMTPLGLKGSSDGPREGKEFTYNVDELSPERQEFAEYALKAWSDVAKVTFKKVHGDKADIVFKTPDESSPDAGEDGGASVNAFAWEGASVNVPDTKSWLAGPVGETLADKIMAQMSDEMLKSRFNLNDEQITLIRNGEGDEVIETILELQERQHFVHEIGHALGLGHPGPYNGPALSGPTFDDDSWQLSVMSYTSQDLVDAGDVSLPITPQMADMLAIQRLYGAAEARTGNTVYAFNVATESNQMHGSDDEVYNLGGFNNNTSYTIYDTGGIDTLDASAYDQNQNIDLRNGAFSDIGGREGNIGIYLDIKHTQPGAWTQSNMIIERARGGSGNDTVTGNDFNNALYGNDGYDRVYGLAGDDLLFGDGPYMFDDGGNDLLDGGQGDDVLYAMGGDDILIGGHGDDRLFGYAGSDQLTGGDGDDRFIFELHPDSSSSTWGIDDVVTDFRLHGDDELVFHGGPAKFEDLEIDTLSEFGTRISYEGNSVTLVGFHGLPDSDDLVFTGPTVIA